MKRKYCVIRILRWRIPFGNSLILTSINVLQFCAHHWLSQNGVRLVMRNQLWTQVSTTSVSLRKHLIENGNFSKTFG